MPADLATCLVLINYYTLRALTKEWNSQLRGAVVLDVYSQVRGELALAMAHADDGFTLIVRLDGPLRSIYSRHGQAKARRNVAAALQGVVGRSVQVVRVADRDRHLFLDLDSGLTVQVTPFGPRPNVYLVDTKGSVSDAFLRRNAVIGHPAPPIRSANMPSTFEAFLEAWPADDRSAERAFSRTLPLFDRVLSREALARAGTTPESSASLPGDALRRCWEAYGEIESELALPAPRIYADDHATRSFSLIPLRHLQGDTEDQFDSVDAAIATFVRRRLAEQAYVSRRDPLQRRLVAEKERLIRSLERIQTELTAESRADRYEHWAHVLMALSHDVPVGSREALLPDVFEAGSELRIPLDPRLSAVENAAAYYDRARQTRAARDHAVRRLDHLHRRQTLVTDALEALEDSGDAVSLRAFEERYAPLLKDLVRPGDASGDQPRFRTFRVADGFEVLVGKNAAQNDRLTFATAANHDYWLHARGTPGSHVVLRVPGRNQEPSRSAMEDAASIAAYYSKASGSGLVPVIATRRKYVRKARKGPPGAVLVERENVLIVPPRLPSHEAESDEY